MSAFTIYVHPAVELDYSEAYHWYELQRLGLGEELLANVRVQMQKIKDAPESFGSKGKKGFREAMVDGFPYLIVYKIYLKERRIFISSIHHTKKHPKKKYRK